MGALCEKIEHFFDIIKVFLFNFPNFAA